MASEWKECTLAELGEIVGGATPSTKDESNYGGDIAWITPKDLSTLKGRFIAHGERNITKKGLNSCSTQMMPTNAVLFSSRAPIGYVAIAKNPVCTNQGFKSIVANADNDPMFLYYLLKYNKDAIEAMGSGTTFKEVSSSTMRGIRVRVPKSKAEQQRIASILAALDSKIENNDKTNDNLQRQLLALYSELLVAHDIQQTVDLKTLCAFQEGYVNPSQTHPEYFDGNVKWLRAVDINESFIIETSRTLTTAGFESAKKSALLFQPNTIAISKSGTIGRLGIIADYMCGNRAVINIRPHNPSHLPLIYAFLKSRQKEFPDLAVGSVQKNLYVSILESLQLVLPETTAVDAFCNTGCAILELIRNNCQENVSLTNLRDSLLPKLMTGKIDVSSIDT